MSSENQILAAQDHDAPGLHTVLTQHLGSGGLKCERHLAEQADRKFVLARTSSRSRKRIEQEFGALLPNPKVTEANRTQS
jgi:hypothetical protein